MRPIDILLQQLTYCVVELIATPSMISIDDPGYQEWRRIRLYDQRKVSAESAVNDLLRAYAKVLNEGIVQDHEVTS